MPASSSDFLIKGARRFTTSIGAGGVPDAAITTIPLTSVSGLPTDTAVEITIDRVDANGNLTPSKEEVVRGVVSGSNLINCVRGVEGTAQDHSAGATVEVRLTASQWNRMIDHLLAEHNQDGTHKMNGTTAGQTLRYDGTKWVATSDLFIDSTGNVGIGTTTPGARFEINPTVTAITDTTMFKSGIVYNGATAMANWYGAYIAAPTGTGTITNKYALVTEANAGNVGIGTTTPAGKLQVLLPDLTYWNNDHEHVIFGSGSNNKGIRFGYNSTEHYGVIGVLEPDVAWGSLVLQPDSNPSRAFVGIGTTTPGYKLDVSGSVHAGSFPTSSDIRFKKNIKSLRSRVSVLKKIEDLHGVYFNWNKTYKKMRGGSEERQIGLIAQEVKKKFPELVSTWGNGSDYLAVEYGRFTAVLLEAIKELNEKVKKIEKKLALA